MLDFIKEHWLLFVLIGLCLILSIILIIVAVKVKKKEKALEEKEKRYEEFIKQYKTWDLMYELPKLHLKIYEFKLINNKSILAFDVDNGKYKSVQFQILNTGESRGYIGFEYCFQYYYLRFVDLIKWLKTNREQI